MSHARAVLIFFGLTLLVSWVCFTASAGGPLFFAGVFAPALVAIGLTAWHGGRAGVTALLGRMVHAPGRPWLYVFAVGFVAAVKLTAALLHRVFLNEWPPFGPVPLAVMLGAVLVSTPVQAGEEIGWRGYALPRLAQQMGLAWAAVVLGLVWAVWHLPIFFIAASDTFGQSFPVYAMSVTALSVVMAWLYWRSGGSVLLTMLMHAAVNNTKDIVPSAAAAASTPFTLQASPMAWLTAALLWAFAAWCLVRMRGAVLREPSAGITHPRAATLDT